jgi:ubiquinol oxidase
MVQRRRWNRRIHGGCAAVALLLTAAMTTSRSTAWVVVDLTGHHRRYKPTTNRAMEAAAFGGRSRLARSCRVKDPLRTRFDTARMWSNKVDHDSLVSTASTTTTPLAEDQTASLSVVMPPLNDAVFGFNKLLIDAVYAFICTLYPLTGNVHSRRDYVRFYVLETVARVPYFAYLSVLHLRETLGQRAIGDETMRDRMRTHYAEADNELHHLLIMESLLALPSSSSSESSQQPNSNPEESAITWWDTTLAQTMAFGYYWYVVLVYALNEPAAYHLSELIEDHAYHTYDSYLAQYGNTLKTLPVPDIAREYYVDGDSYFLDLYRTVRSSSSCSDPAAATHRSDRPALSSLYDVFVCIRNDEREHWKTLCNLVQYNDMQAIPAEQVQSTQPGAPETRPSNPNQ